MAGLGCWLGLGVVMGTESRGLQEANRAVLDGVGEAGPSPGLPAPQGGELSLA